jgi:hypothetical protein
MPGTSLERGHVFTDTSQIEPFSELNVSPTTSSSSIIYPTKKYYSVFTNCPVMGFP